MTFLAIDIGNTRLKWAQYDTPRPGAQLLAHGAEFLENIDRLADGPWAALTPPATMLGCVVAGDAARRRVEEQMELWDVSPQWVVASDSEAGLTNGYDFPTRLGAGKSLTAPSECCPPCRNCPAGRKSSLPRRPGGPNTGRSPAGNFGSAQSSGSAAGPDPVENL